MKGTMKWKELKIEIIADKGTSLASGIASTKTWNDAWISKFAQKDNMHQ